MKHLWNFKPEPNEDVVDQLNSSLGFEILACKILAVKGIDTYQKAREFFKPEITDLHDPFLMKDMDLAVKRIDKAITSNEKILIYGDYDVDGTTAVALMYLYLSKIYTHKNIEFYIPDRNVEGYGISELGIEYAKQHDFKLIIALDCGIRASDKIAYAKELGIDFIICDHHLPSAKIPDAVAVLDPKRLDCQYPYKELSGCGVGYKLCCALNSTHNKPQSFMFELCDLLVISIAADIVAMTGENRNLAKIGLKELQKTKRFGLKALINSDKLANFTISNIVFEIAPKINAAGRIKHAKAAVELMISDKISHAQQMVEDIVKLNNMRREFDVSMTTDALKQIENEISNQTYTNIAYHSNWNKGVIGIVASRLIETYYKPTLVFTDGTDGEMVGSARSVADFDVHHALELCSDLLTKFGGHRAAAGLSLKKENFEAFKIRFEQAVKNTLKDEQKQPTIDVDLEMRISDLNPKFFKFHKKLEPFGPLNMKPIFFIKQLKAHSPLIKMGVDGAHLKFMISQKDSDEKIECIGFKFGNLHSRIESEEFDLLFSIEENNWRNSTTYFLSIKDIRFKDEI